MHSPQANLLQQSSFFESHKKRKSDMEGRHQQLEDKLSKKFNVISQMNSQRSALSQDRRLWEEDVQYAVVLDVGSFYTKIGTAGDSHPQFVERTAIGKNQQGQVVCGKEAIDLGIFQVPVQRGIIVNFDLWKDMLSCFFDKATMSVLYKAVIFTEPINNPKANREKIIEIMFDVFQVDYFYIIVDAFGTLIQTNRATGTVLESGAGVTHVVSFQDGELIPNSSYEIKFGGNDLDIMMQKKLNDSQIQVSLEEARNIKEKVGYIALDFQQELKKNLQREVQLENRIVKINQQQCQVPEVMFQPSLFNQNFISMQKAVQDSIKNSKIEYQENLYYNIIFGGGNTMFPGFKDRLQKEITNISPKYIEANVFSNYDKQYSAWIGCALLADLYVFQKQWVTRKEYDEAGPGIVNRKCI